MLPRQNARENLRAVHAKVRRRRHYQKFPVLEGKMVTIRGHSKMGNEAKLDSPVRERDRTPNPRSFTGIMCL